MANALADNFITEDELKAMTNTSEVSARATDYQNKSEIYNKKKTEYDNIDKTVRAEMDKLGLASFSGIVNDRIAEMRESLLPELTIAQNEMNTSYGIYTDAKASSLAIVDRNIALYKEKQAQEAQIASEQRQMQNALTLSQAQFDQKLTQQSQIMNDPNTAIPSLISQYADLGVMSQKSAQEHIASFQEQNAKYGTTIGEYISKMNQDFQSKPEYQRIQAIQTGQMSDREKLQSSQAFDLKKTSMEQNFQMQLAQAKQTTSQKWTKLDDGMYQDQAGNIITGDELKNAKLMNNSYITKQVGEVGGEC